MTFAFGGKVFGGLTAELTLEATTVEEFIDDCR